MYVFSKTGVVEMSRLIIRRQNTEPEVGGQRKKRNDNPETEHQRKN